MSPFPGNALGRRGPAQKAFVECDRLGGRVDPQLTIEQIAAFLIDMPEQGVIAIERRLVHEGTVCALVEGVFVEQARGAEMPLLMGEKAGRQHCLLDGVDEVETQGRAMVVEPFLKALAGRLVPSQQVSAINLAEADPCPWSGRRDKLAKLDQIGVDVVLPRQPDHVGVARQQLEIMLLLKAADARYGLADIGADLFRCTFGPDQIGYAPARDRLPPTFDDEVG